ncbi:unnamed protein product [Urochloa decumbens]|uniref:Glucose/Sorbosone dehydrogenase domain-containing protein n=1 Tax=Urochloa decumbens TaxID=240449 RepID=A0ABC8VY01_9POAL
MKCIPSLSAVLFNTVDPSTTTKLAVSRLCASTTSSTSLQHHTTTGRSWQEQNTMCLERITSGSYLAMAPHPDGSGRVFLSTLEGMILLVSVPRGGSGVALRVDNGRAHPFLDLRDRVLRLLGIAFHPEFATNGRFFVSYHCDSSTSIACSASRCWGSAPGNSSWSCRYQLIVAEFSAKGGENYSKATHADPSEVRRIFAMGLPHPKKLYSYQRHHGQILFSPSGSDGCLYLITGHGDFFKNERSFLGKILRFDVDRMLKGGSQGTGRQGTPWMGKPEIFSTSVKNPSGCSFDSDRSSHLYCADVDEQQYERVYLVTKGGNRGSRSSKVQPSLVIDHGRPADGRMPSIVGGLMYRGSADPSLKGRYLYIYASSVWTGVPPPESRSNGHYTSSKLSSISCSRSSPLPCRRGGISGRVLSLAEDNGKDAFFLTTGGVFRVVPPRMCDVPQQPQQWPPGTGWVISTMLLSMVFAVYVVWSVLSGGGQIRFNNRFGNIHLFSFYCYQNFGEGMRRHQE